MSDDIRALPACRDPELRAVLSAVSPFCTAVDAAGLHRAAIVDRAAEAGLLASLAHRLPAAWQRVEGLETALKRVRQREALKATLLHALCNQVLQLAAHHHIRAVVMKGAFTELVLHGGVGHRGFSDVDLLVDPDGARGMHAALLAAGFTRVGLPDRTASVEDAFEWTYLTPLPQRLLVDLHRAPCEPDYVRVDVNAWLRRAERVATDQGERPGLCPEDLLLHLALHAASHAFELNLRTFLDGALLLHQRRVDLDAVVQQARACGAAVPLWLMLNVLAELFCAPVPDAVMRAVAPGRIRQRYLRAHIPWRTGRLAVHGDNNRRRILTGIFPLLDGPGHAARFVGTYLRRRVLDRMDAELERRSGR